MILTIDTAFGPCGLRSDRGALVAAMALSPSVMRLPWSAVLRQVQCDPVRFTAVQCRIDLTQGVAASSILIRRERWAGPTDDGAGRSRQLRAGLERLTAMLIRFELSPRMLTGQQIVALDDPLSDTFGTQSSVRCAYLTAPLNGESKDLGAVLSAAGDCQRAVFSLTATLVDQRAPARITAAGPECHHMSAIARLLPGAKRTSGVATWDRLRALGGGPAAPELALLHSARLCSPIAWHRR